jgi:hypothetical protein
MPIKIGLLRPIEMSPAAIQWQSLAANFVVRLGKLRERRGRLRLDLFLELRLLDAKDTVGHDLSMDGSGYR